MERGSGLELVLEKVPLFASLSAEDRTELSSRFLRRQYRRGEAVFRQGDPGTQLFVIEEGRVKIATLSEDGREALVAVLGPGEVFGEIALFGSGERSATAQTMEPAVISALAHSVFKPYVEEHPVVAWELLGLLAQRLRQADEIVQEIIFFDVPGRVAKRLLDLGEKHGSADNGEVRIEVPLTQEEIAQMVGASRESVNKALSAFQERGWVQIAERTYTITDPEALARRIR